MNAKSQGLDGKKNITCLTLFNQWQNLSHQTISHWNTKTESFHSKCLQIYYYVDEEKAFAMDGALNMDRKNAYMQWTKLFRVRKWVWEEEIEESVQKKISKYQWDSKWLKEGEGGREDERMAFNHSLLTEWLIGVAVPMLSCSETGHWWIARLQGDVYFVVNLHICMYLQSGWLLLARISPHRNMMNLAVWQNGQLSDRDIQPALCSHDGWAHANMP